MTGLGSLIVDTVTLPIARVHLRAGKVMVECRRWGPVQAVSSDSYAVYGDDGHLVWRASGVTPGLVWDRVRPGLELVVLAPLAIYDVTPAATPDTVGDTRC